MHLLPYCIDRGCLSGGGYVCDYVLYKSRLFLCLCAYVSACVHCANELRNTNNGPKKYPTKERKQQTLVPYQLPKQRVSESK